MTSFALIFSLLLPVVMGVMQGMKKFMTLGWNNVINFSIKLIFGVFFVYLGLRVYGALIGLLLGMFIAWIIGIFVVFGHKEEKQELNLFSKQELFPFIGLLIITLLYSLDILIGKFILAPGIMGDYSKISLIGKIVLFASMTVTTVMFPLSSERHASGNNPAGIIRKAGLLIFFICLVSIIVAKIFPDQLLMLLFGKKFLYLSPIVFPVIVAFSGLSGIVLLVLSKISTEKFGRNQAILTILALIIQMTGLALFGSSIASFSDALMISSIINFILLWILFKR
jgi:O-antigen/teichoic acid export membrane protein